MHEEIKYKKGIVSFLDILGFRHLLSTKSPTELARVLEIFRHEGDPKQDYDDSWAGMYQYAALSDCFFRYTEAAHEANADYPTGLLFSELVALVSVQGNMLSKGYLIRGAVTIRDYYGSADEHGSSIFGPAITRAYEIETKMAKYPRIVIDPALIGEFWSSNLLKSVIHGHKDEWTDHLKLYLRRDDSGVWFVDYLSGTLATMDEPSPTLKFFRKHKALIESHIEDLLKKPRPCPDSITDNVLWLLRYHNSAMLAISEAEWHSMSDDDHEAKKEEFLIEVPDHPTFKEFELLKENEDGD